MSELFDLYQNKRKVAFCAATQCLPSELRQVIWSKQGKCGGVYGNTKPIGLEDLIDAILEENDMDEDTFEELVSENTDQSGDLVYIVGLYDIFKSKFSSTYILAYLNGTCFQDLEVCPNAGLDFAEYVQAKKYKQYMELDGEEETRELEEEFKFEYENNLFGHTSGMDEDWKLGSNIVFKIVHLALDVLGIDLGNAHEVRKVFKSQFLAAYEIAVCNIWMPYMFDLITE